jgi:hypothetical protein
LPCLPQSAFPAPLRIFRQAGRDSSVPMYGSLQMERLPLKKEKSMETVKTEPAIANDVLHLGGSKLSPEEVAKALAHHNRHHSGDQPQQAAAKLAGKKGKSGK